MQVLFLTTAAACYLAAMKALFETLIRRTLRLVAVSMLWAATAGPAGAAFEIPLFDPDGHMVAFINFDDENLTIYLLPGEPVAYLYSSYHGHSIYGFNGEHLGWFEDGVIRDNEGHMVGYGNPPPGGLFAKPPAIYPRSKPFRSIRRLEPLYPLDPRDWSDIPLADFLAAGVEE